MNRIIVFEPQDPTRTALRQKLESEGHAVVECASAAALLEKAKEAALAVISGDGNGASTAPLVRELARIWPRLPTVGVCADADEDVKALEAGATYVVRRPVHADEIALLIRRAVGQKATLRGSVEETDASSSVLIGETPAMRAIQEMIQRLRTSPSTTVLVTGESGAGKDAIVRAIHAATAPQGSLVHLTPAAFQDSSLEVELFGSEGAGEFASRPGLLEQAEGGTLLLDEIADMPPSLQGRLLRFLEEKKFRPVGATADRSCETRVIASTSQDLSTLSQSGALRRDLVYRLAVVVVEVPPLRRRRADIPLLVPHVLDMLRKRIGHAPKSVSPAAMNLLIEHSWPGNVRELCNVLERAVLLGESEVLEARHLTITTPSSASSVGYRLPPEGIDFRHLEREIVGQALNLARGNQTRAASLLGMTRDQIRYRIAKFGMAIDGGPASTSSPSPPLASVAAQASGDIAAA